MNTRFLTAMLLALLLQTVCAPVASFSDNESMVKVSIRPITIQGGVARLDTFGSASIEFDNPNVKRELTSIPKGILSAIQTSTGVTIVARTHALDQVLFKRDEVDESVVRQLRDRYLSTSFELGFLEWEGTAFRYRKLLESPTLRDFTDWCVTEEFIVVLAVDNRAHVVSLNTGEMTSVMIDLRSDGRLLCATPLNDRQVLIATSAGAVLQLDCSNLNMSHKSYNIGLPASIAIVPTGSLLAFSMVGQCDVRLIDSESGKEKKRIMCSGPVLDIEVSDGGDFLAAQTARGVSVHHLASGQLAVEVELGEGSRTMAFHVGPRLLVSESIRPIPLSEKKP
jgi:hypothetical protein